MNLLGSSDNSNQHRYATGTLMNFIFMLSAIPVDIEQFTDCYYIKYEKIHCARKAKAFVDRKNFYGGT